MIRTITYLRFCLNQLSIPYFLWNDVINKFDIDFIIISGFFIRIIHFVCDDFIRHIRVWSLWFAFDIGIHSICKQICLSFPSTHPFIYFVVRPTCLCKVVSAWLRWWSEAILPIVFVSDDCTIVIYVTIVRFSDTRNHDWVGVTVLQFQCKDVLFE